jgi:hypothetical protein
MRRGAGAAPPLLRVPALIADSRSDSRRRRRSPRASCGRRPPPEEIVVRGVRPGAPGIDYRTPDGLVTGGLPDAQRCALRMESQ